MEVKLIEENNEWKKSVQKSKKKISNLEFLLILVLVILGVYIYWHLSTDKKICDSEECLGSATEILEIMDTSVDPCEDFYSFACGNLFKTSSEGGSSIIHEKRRNDLKLVLLEQITKDDRAPLPAGKIFFQYCLDTGKIDEENDEIFFKLLEELGGWPLILGSAWEEDKFDWVSFMIKCIQKGMPYNWFISFDLSENNYLKITFPGSDISPTNRGHLETLHMDLIYETAVSLGASKIITLKEAAKFLQFEDEFQKVINSALATNSSTLYNIEELNDMFPKINWENVLNSISESMVFTNESVIVLEVASYLRELDLLLVRTARRTQANYIIWKLIEYFLPYMKDVFRERHWKYTTIVNKEMCKATRMDFCLDSTLTRFENIAEMASMKGSEKDKSLNDMILKLKNEIRNRLENAEWMDEESKDANLERLEGLFENVADSATFEYLGTDSYDNFSADSIIEMIRENNIINLRTLFESCKTIPSNSSANSSEGTSFADNINYLPKRYFQSEFFSEHRTNYLNYGSLGTIINYIILYNFLWETNWSNITEEAFNSRMDCFDSNGEFEGTLKTTVAYSSSIDLAFAAYQDWRLATANGNEAKLPGLDYTPDQLFWLQCMANYCYGRLSSRQLVEENLSKEKILFILQNSRYLGEIFKCSRGSSMNPYEKCQLL